MCRNRFKSETLVCKNGRGAFGFATFVQNFRKSCDGGMQKYKRKVAVKRTESLGKAKMGRRWEEVGIGSTHQAEAVKPG